MTTLADTISAIADQYRHRTAVVVDGHYISYGHLIDRARLLAAALRDAGLDPETMRGQPPRVAILADQSPIAYSALIALALNGQVGVPLDPSHPPARLRACLKQADVRAIIAGHEALDRLPHLLGHAGRSLAVIHPGGQAEQLSARFRRHRFRDLSSLSAPPAAAFPLDDSAPAYLLFTSGTTDAPRGVLLHWEALADHLRDWHQRLPLRPGERVAQTFESGFDLALHTTWSTWLAGASLFVWHRRANHDPAAFLRHHRITHWPSLPTVAMTMHRQGELRPSAFPSLRATLFAGEPLPASLVSDWARAAPRSQIINLYGPTEATIAITAYDCPAHGVSPAAHQGIVCLGHPFSGHQRQIIDADGQTCSAGDVGELWLTGPRVVDRYVAGDDPTRFVERDGHRWFRTGDLVSADPLGRLFFHCRQGQSFKLRGHHVELPAIDQVLRSACGHSMACAVGWPRDHVSVLGLVGVIASDEDLDTRRLLAHCRRLLPPALVPDAIVARPQLPTTPRGKIDRPALRRFLDHHPQEV